MSGDLKNRLESFETIDAIFDALAEGDEEKLDEALLSDLSEPESEIFAHDIQFQFHPPVR